MSQDPRLTPLVASLPATVPFVGPEAQERSAAKPFRARLGANESSLGPSPKAVEAMAQAAREAWKYCDPEAHDLRQAIAAHHGVAPENILLGEGIDGLLGLAVRTFLAPGEVAVTSAGAYPTFNYHVAGFGGKVHTVPFQNDHEDPETLLAAARDQNAKLVYISNPDNPMGTWHSADTIQRMIKNTPEGALLLLDEAYIELAPDGTAPMIDPDDARVLRFRTFSKAYGLAGIRVGYAIGPAHLIAAFDRIKNHFGLNRIGQAGALAALHDADWLAKIQSETAAARDRLAAIAADNGLRALPSATNFVTIDCGQDGDFARRVLAALIADGVFVRMPFVAPQDRCIRISAGTMDELDIVADALPRALSIARGA